MMNDLSNFRVPVRGLPGPPGRHLLQRDVHVEAAPEGDAAARALQATRLLRLLRHRERLLHDAVGPRRW